MKKNGFFRIIGGFIVCTFAVAFWGCTASYDLIENGTGSIEIIAAGDEYASITELDLYQDGRYLVISGNVEEKDHRRPPDGYDAHVDMAVFAPNGKLVKRRSAGISPAGGIEESLFKVRVPYLAEEGTLVRFAYHSGHPLAGGGLNCGDNAALPDPKTPS
jgi:hypothetical protein